MATKLRSFSTNAATKAIGFLLIVGLITSMVFQMAFAAYQGGNPESIVVKKYEDSEEFHIYINNAIFYVTDFNKGSVYTNNYLKKAEFLYFCDDGTRVTNNTGHSEREYYEQQDSHYFIYEDGTWYGNDLNEVPLIINDRMKDINRVYLTFPKELMERLQQEWTINRNYYIQVITSIAICFIITILLLIHQFAVSGRRPEDKEVHLTKFDRIYTDILFIAIIFSISLWVGSASEIFPRYLYYGDNRKIYSVVSIGILTSFVTIVVGVTLLSLVRKGKAGVLLKHSLIYKAYKVICDFFSYLLNGRMFEKYPLTKTLFYRQLAFIIASAVMVFFTLLFFAVESALVLFPPIAEIVIIYFYIKGNREIYEDINKGFNESLEEQMKSERMKVQLITNVSHDLKTPLTSIISYVDLLSKEEELSDTAKDYIKILQDKSERLKTIVTDLFELAKSNSGDAQLELETLDLKKLLEQTLGDMLDKVEASGLSIKQKLPENAVMIRADGKRLYRVFLNVIDNALKYSLKGTRVFVELEEQENRAVAVIKNIAGYEMDFTAYEVLQRFTRGDKSRSTEGSGLGLSIAESFTRVCGGDFKVEVDGDMFKVTVSFNLIP